MSADCSFRSSVTSFRNRVSSKPGSDFPAEAGRYHLVAALACPFAHRTLILRSLKGLQVDFDTRSHGFCFLLISYKPHLVPAYIPQALNCRRLSPWTSSIQSCQRRMAGHSRNVAQMGLSIRLVAVKGQGCKLNTSGSCINMPILTSQAPFLCQSCG